MIVLYIVLGILAFILLLLCIPVEIEAKYSEQLSLKIRYLFIPFNIYPRKTEQDRSEKRLSRLWNTHFAPHLTKVRYGIRKARIWVRVRVKKAKIWLKSKLNIENKPSVEQPKKRIEAKEKSSFAQLREARGFSGMVALLWRVFSLVTGAFGRVFRSITVQKFDFTAEIGGEDAADVAVSYGKWCSVLYPLLAAILGAARRYNKNISITPDFSNGKTSVRADALLRVFPVVLVHHAAGAFLKLIFLEIKDAIKQKMDDASQEASKNINQGGAI